MFSKLCNGRSDLLLHVLPLRFYYNRNLIVRLIRERTFIPPRKSSAKLTRRNPSPNLTRRLAQGVRHSVSIGGYDTPCQFDERCEKPGERDSHQAVPIAVAPHRLITAEVPLGLSPSPQHILTISVRPKLSSRAFWHSVSDTSRQFDEWCEKPGERDSHKPFQSPSRHTD